MLVIPSFHTSLKTQDALGTAHIQRSLSLGVLSICYERDKDTVTLPKLTCFDVCLSPQDVFRSELSSFTLFLLPLVAI